MAAFRLEGIIDNLFDHNVRPLLSVLGKERLCV